MPAGRKYYKKMLKQYFDQHMIHFDIDIVLMFFNTLNPEMKEQFIEDRLETVKDKLDYIDPTLYSNLAGAYEIADAFNREIDSAKKYKSSSYVASIDVSRLREPLAKSKQGLEGWIEANKGQKKVTDS